VFVSFGHFHPSLVFVREKVTKIVIRQGPVKLAKVGLRLKTLTWTNTLA
jgi:hypothetical protein